MTMLPTADSLSAQTDRAGRKELSVTARSWGYAIHSAGGHSFAVFLTQVLCAAAGAAGTMAAMALMFLPSMTVLPGMQIGAAVVILAISAYFMWYATRGLDLWIEIDLHQGEVREVTNSRIGRKSTLGRYGFDGIANIASVPGDYPGETRVYLVNHSKTAFLCVADGPRGVASELAARLRGDLLVSKKPVSDLRAGGTRLRLVS